jgi:elongation factor G
MRAYTFKEESLGSEVVETPIPDEMAAEAEKARAELIESVSESDEQLIEAYLENPDVPVDLLIASLRRATISNRIVPVLCGSSLKNKAVQPLLDAAVNFLPSPLDVPSVVGIHPKTEKEIERPAGDFEPFSALAFKLATDAFVGKLAFVRIYSGKLEKKQNVFNPRTKNAKRLDA